jgi:lysophospholipase L1-like esterase
MFLISAALASDVVVFGDSWAEGAADELEDALHDMGHRDLDVDPQGIGGTTAEYWASLPSALPDAVSANADARWVWLSIGGNDLFAHYYAGNGANNAADYDNHLRVMLDAHFAAHPDVKVVMFGYDFVNFEQSEECILTAWTYFGTSITSAQVNQYFLDQVGGTLAAIGADYPNFTYVDTAWGALQAAGGVAGAPNVLFPSPSEYMSDCIHPTSEGYTIVHEAWVGEYWGVDEPTVSITGDADACVGGALVLTADTTGAERVSWTIDGAAAGTGDTLSVPTATAGTLAVAARADAGAWDDTDELPVTVWATPAPVIEGPASTAVGEAATFGVALEEGETAVWSAPGGTIVDDTGDTLVVRWDGPGAYVVSVEVATPGGCAVQAEVAVAVAADEADAADSGDPADPNDTAGSNDERGCGCGSTVPPHGVLALMGLLLVRRRR